MKNMIKVKVNVKVDQNVYAWTVHEELKKWCRDTFGKNQRGKPPTWRSYYEYGCYESNVSMIFFFALEKHANWFKMRWM